MTGRSDKQAFIGLGGNIGKPAEAMAAALRMLDEHVNVKVFRVSSLYCTPPWGVPDQPDFLNAAAELRTSCSPHELLALCLHIERLLKRERQERWGPRLIDIDLLLYEGEQLSDKELELPHPRMKERAFVLVPLLEIVPDLELDARPAADFLAGLDVSAIERLTTDGQWWKGR